MAQYDHLPLLRVGEPTPRRKQPAPIEQPKRAKTTHSKKLGEDLEMLVAHFRASTPNDAVDPTLIFKVQVEGVVADEEWEKINLQLLTHIDDQAVILFADDVQLDAFDQRLTAYAGDKPEDQKSQPYEAFISAISGLSPLEPIDRISAGLKSDGFDTPDKFEDNEDYLLDVELWRPAQDLVDVFVDRVLPPFEEMGGVELSRYTPSAGVLLRVLGPGTAIKALLACPEVATIERPPQPDLEEGGVPLDTIEALEEVRAVPSDAVRIGIIDSGVNDGHPLLSEVVVAAVGIGDHPAGDDKGHGTAVAAIAAYGDLDTMRDSGSYAPRFAIASARVVDSNGQFDDMTLAPDLTDQAIRTLHDEHGCRIINLSLADPNKVMKQQGTIWSAMLDTLARELDIIIVASAGNTDAAALIEAHGNNVVNVYPTYLADEPNRLLDPAGAINTLTVGALAHVNGLSDDDDVSIQHFAEEGEPAPFTRVGPGIGDAIKPDLVEYGGTAVYDGAVQKIKTGADHPAAGILTLHHQYTERLFATFSGTSFAAPLVAYKAAMILERFPNASANFVRALLALGAEQPSAGLKKIGSTRDADTLPHFGYGQSDVTASLFSDDDRVILTADGTLVPDQFAVYALPITSEFQTETGLRKIRIGLAFDPPVRRSRKDYAGIRMRFDLVRGASQEDVFDAYRALKEKEDKPEKLPDRQFCKFSPGIEVRQSSSLQCATFTMQQNISDYGDMYFVVVRCLGRWAADLVEVQPFSLMVMMQHEARIQLYERVQIRLRASER